MRRGLLWVLDTSIVSLSRRHFNALNCIRWLVSLFTNRIRPQTVNRSYFCQHHLHNLHAVLRCKSRFIWPFPELLLVHFLFPFLFVPDRLGFFFCFLHLHRLLPLSLQPFSLRGYCCFCCSPHFSCFPRSRGSYISVAPSLADAVMFSNRMRDLCRPIRRQRRTYRCTWCLGWTLLSSVSSGCAFPHQHAYFFLLLVHTCSSVLLAAFCPRARHPPLHSSAYP